MHYLTDVKISCRLFSNRASIEFPCNCVYNFLNMGQDFFYFKNFILLWSRFALVNERMYMYRTIYNWFKKGTKSEQNAFFDFNEKRRKRFTSVKCITNSFEIDHSHSLYTYFTIETPCIHTYTFRFYDYNYIYLNCRTMEATPPPPLLIDQGGWNRIIES